MFAYKCTLVQEHAHMHSETNTYALNLALLTSTHSSQTVCSHYLVSKKTIERRM